MKIEEGTISAFNAKTHLSQLLSALEKDGQEFIITKRGKPIARLSPFDTTSSGELSPDDIVSGFKKLRARQKPLGSELTLKDLYRAGREECLF